MKAPKAPRLDERRTAEFSAELRARARAWIPSWGLDDNEHDFGRALLEIAARFNSEVAERLDDAGEKMRRGFLDWLGVRGEAARPARMPVVFKLADTAREGVLASAPVRLQADAAGTPVVFETEDEVQIVPGRLDVVVGVDGEADAFYLPPPGLSELKPLEPLPTEWQLRSFASSGTTVLQLDPESGLFPDTILETAGQQYRIVKVDKDLVTIDPPLAGGLAAESSFTKVTTFAPFDGKTRNQQEHALYLGDSELLNIEAKATIEVVGASVLQEGFVWKYWGKLDNKEEVKWQSLTLDPEKQTSGGPIVLTKPKGAIEELEIGGKKSRWIRASTETIPADAKPVDVDFFSLKINSPACGDFPTQCPPPNPIESPKAEAMANTSPLVLDNIFLPFGREPRQFDAFYLGSAEAFSKKGARVRICFELADPTFESLAAVRGSGIFAKTVVAGVGRDRALHLFQFAKKDGSPTVSRFLDRDALRPPIPGDSGVIPPETKPRLLDPACKPVITTSAQGDDFFVSVASGGTIWTWHENAADGTLSGWQKPEQLPIPPDTAHLDDIVFVDASLVPTVVLSSSRMWVRNQAEWSEKRTEIRTDPENPQLVELVALVPILKGNDLDSLVAEQNTVGVSKDQKLYEVATDGKCTLLPLEPVDAGTSAEDTTARKAIRPVAHKSSDTLVVVTANKDLNSLVMFQQKDGSPPTTDRIELPSGDRIVGATVELSFVTGFPQFSVLCKTKAGATYIASWQPTVSGATVKKFLFTSAVSNLGTLGGAPVVIRNYIVAPGVRGDLFVAPFEPNERHVIRVVNPRDGAVLPNNNQLFLKDDELSIIQTGGRIHRVIAENPLVPPASLDVLYPVTSPFGVPENPENTQFLGYRRTNPSFNGEIAADSKRKMKLDALDAATVEGSVLLIKVNADVQLYNVGPISNTNPRIAELDRDVSPTGTPTEYWTPETLAGRVAPVLDIDPAEGNWIAEFVARARLYFSPPVDPNVQRAKAFGLTGIRPKVIALTQLWKTPPAMNEPYVLDGTLGDWQHLLADTSANPELSWEYSNGTAWESLILEEEGTLNFKNTGAVSFKVPTNLAAVDWAGKTNHWIRARLIGGDYGREEVSVKIKDLGNHETQQIVVRDAKGIHAPAVVKLHISYGFCCKNIHPAFVLTKDSGTIRDQSDANRTPGAIVEAFVPLALTLRRLTKPVAATEPAEPIKDSPLECDCETPEPTADGVKSTARTTSQNEKQVIGRELYIGLDATPSETPVNVLLLVDEHDHRNFAPLKIEALIADRFVPIVADDKTRALGESGLLSMTFAIPPTRSELFGRENLTWLRLIPKSNTTDQWIPTLRGAYLNAAWASATETLTRELLGSSDGAPNLVVRLARPPVLNHTLELRVKEPLGEEERKALVDGDANSVLSLVEGLSGDWVLWTQVIDPDDEDETARVYSLDETTGEIRFGDGRHGKIPPIGRDSIVAFRYCRTEPDPKGGDSVPGNTIAARAVLNLVSPVETVETVTAADQAAGGAPPESDDRVLRFGFARQRHRSRAVTAYDLEDLALQSSPDIVQARAFVRRGYVRLVVVMRGKNPRPNAAQIRELRRILLEAAPLSLSAPKALRIEPPRIRRLRIELTLLVEALDHTGELSASVKQKLAEFFDTATGGLDKDGWALGNNPGEADIALAISDAPYLESIEKVTRFEITADGTELRWVDSAGATEIVMLDEDPVRLNFETAEVMA